MTTTNTQTFLSAQERTVLCRTWRELYATREAIAFDFLLYALLRGKDPRAGFSPIRNSNKLNNGSAADQSYRRTLLAASNMAGHRMSATLRVLFPAMSAERNAELVGALCHAATIRYYTKAEA